MRIPSSRRFAVRVHSAALALALSAPFASQASDHALSFSSNAHLVSTTGQISSLSFTVEAWVKVATFTGENQILSQYTGGTGAAGRMIVALRNTKASFFIGGTWLDSNANVPSNTWTHIAVTRSGSTAKIYVNGALDKTSTTFPATALPQVGIVLGGISGMNFGFRGQLAELRAWNIERTLTELQSTKSVRLTGGESGLAGYWRLDEGMGVIALDHAGGANGTIAGPTWVSGTGLPLPAADPEGSWAASSGGSWSDSAKWLGAMPAQGTGAYAFFTNNPPAAVAVNNDVADLKLGRILLAGTNGFTFTGNGLALTNRYVSALISATNGAHAFNLPLAASAGGVHLETRSPASLAFNDAISGPTALLVNTFTNLGGTVTLSAANTFSGPLTLGCGTLAIGSIANGGAACALGSASAAPANLTLGLGTLRYTGPAASTDRGFTLNPGNNRASILSSDTNLTIGGTVNALSGAFIKRGKGTVAFTGAGSNLFSRGQAANLNGFTEYPANGDAPLNGFSGFNVIEGKLVLGAEGQTNVVNGEAWVGVKTTSLAGKEVNAEMEVTGGYTRMNSFFVIGRDHGTTNTAPVPMRPRFTLSGGTFSALNLIVTYGNDANFNAQASADIRGGWLEIDNELRLGDQRGNAAAPATATLNVYGGTVRHSHATQGLTFGWRDPAASGTLNLFGGLVDEAARLKMGQYGSTSRLNLHGGLLRAQNIIQSNPNTNYGQSHLYFNGGVFQPTAAGQTLSGLTTATVSTNGAFFDTSLADYTVAQNLLHDSALGAAADGGLVKLGTNTLTLFSAGSTYTGPTTVSNGTLCIAGALPAGNALVIEPGAEALIGGSATQAVSAASLSLDDAGRLGFAFAADGSSNDRLSVTATPILSGKRFALYLLNTRLPFTQNGTYTLLTYGGAAPNLTGVGVSNPVFGKTYTFAAAGGAVSVTIASDTASASIWSVDAGGDWATDSNWSVAPDDANGAPVRFDSAITSPATVTTAGEFVRQIFLNNASTYTLAGAGLTLTNDAAPASVTVESGAHVITAPLTLSRDTVLDIAPASVLTLGPVSGASASLTAQGNGTLALAASPAVGGLELNVQELALSNALTLTAPVLLQRAVTVRPASATTAAVDAVISGPGGLAKTGSNVLALASANTYTGVTRIDGGMLTAGALANGGQPSSIGAASSANSNLLLGPGTLRYTGPSAVIDRGYTLQAGNGKAGILHTQSDLTIAGKIQGTSGGFIKTGPGTLYLTYPGPQTIGVHEANIDVVQNLSPFGESPAVGFQAFTVSQGKVVVGVPGQTNTVSARMCVGHCTTLLPGAENACELEVNGGAFICNATVSLGRSNGTTTTAPGGISSRITVNSGAVTFNLLALGYNNIGGLSGFNARPVCDVNAGTLTINTYCNVGETTGSSPTVNVRGGTLRANGKHASVPASLLLGGPASAGSGTLNVLGTGLVYCAHNVALATASGASGTLNLSGGLLIASNIVRHTTGSAVLRFNGGVFQPHTVGLTLSGLTAAYVSTNGALIDTSLADGYTVAQNLLADPALGGAPDGGLAKLGTNALSVTGSASTFKGPITVRGGLLKARVCSTNDLFTAAGAAFDALGERATVGDLTGYGPLTNGVIAVAGMLDAGTNGAPAGARMTLQNLSLLAGSAFACDWSTNALGQVTNDFAAVSGTLAAEGPGFVDFGRTEDNPIPMPFRTTILSYGSLAGSFSGWKARNTGLPASTHPSLVVTAAGGLVQIEVRYGGTLLLLN